MAVIVRLEGEMPPVVLPPYSHGAATTVGQLLNDACRFFKREPSESKLVASIGARELDDPQCRLEDYGLGDWSLVSLVPTVERQYPRKTFGA
jgi:hypothetical protein